VITDRSCELRYLIIGGKFKRALKSFLPCLVILIINLMQAQKSLIVNAHLLKSCHETVKYAHDFHAAQAAIDCAAPGETVTLEAGTYRENLVIDKDVTLQGAGAGVTILDGGGVGSVVQVGDAEVTLAGVTLTNGSAPNGGGVYTNNGRVILRDSHIQANHATGSGGGIYAYGGSVTLENTLLSSNTADGTGGGLYTFTGDVSLVNSTVAENTSAVGGGVYNFGGLLTLQSTTVTTNTGGGVFNERGRVLMGNTVLAGNTSEDCWGAFSSEGHNLIANVGADCSFTADTATNITGQDALLTRLDNGLYTLQVGSPAIDSGDGCTPMDALGQVRSACDIGAVEFVGDAALLQPAALIRRVDVLWLEQITTVIENNNISLERSSQVLAAVSMIVREVGTLQSRGAGGIDVPFNPSLEYNWDVVLNHAIATVADAILGNATARLSLYELRDQLDQQLGDIVMRNSFARSVDLGQAIAQVVLEAEGVLN
jgi:hypothetical protein